MQYLGTSTAPLLACIHLINCQRPPTTSRTNALAMVSVGSKCPSAVCVSRIADISRFQIHGLPITAGTNPCMGLEAGQ